MNTTKPRLLIVMPDDMALLLGHILAEKGHQTLTASDVGDAAETMRQGPVDLVILDAGLAPTHDAPEGNAYEFMREAQAPLLVVTSGGEDRLERISCMPEHQSVEFLHRPVRPDELIGRVRHLLRKSRAEELGDVLTFAGVELNLRTRRVHRGERRIDLGPIEFRLLQHLLHRGGLAERRLRGRAHRRCACRPPAQGAERRRRAQPDPHRPLGRLLARFG